MKVRIIGVKHWIEKNSFNVIFHGGSFDTAKAKSYGVNPVEKYCSNISLLDKFISAVGKDVDVTFDMRGNIADISM